MERAAGELAERQAHQVESRRRQALMESTTLGREQGLAFRHVTQARDLSVVVGYAGTGKSTMLAVAREAWEADGYQVRGAALSGIAAEQLEAGSGITSRTVHSLLFQWEQGREELTARTVLVVDEAGMIGSRQMERLLSHAQAAGAKVVLVGDPEQLQAIEAGAAFRAIAERVGAAEITEVRRQREDWQQRGDARAGDRAHGDGAGALRAGRDGAGACHARRCQGGRHHRVGCGAAGASRGPSDHAGVPARRRARSEHASAGGAPGGRRAGRRLSGADGARRTRICRGRPGVFPAERARAWA